MIKNKLSILIIISIFILSSFTGCFENTYDPNEKQKTKMEISQNFLYNLSSENYEKAYSNFNQELKNALTITQLKETWQYVTNLYGNFIEIKTFHNRTEKNFSVIIINATFSENYLLTFKIVFDEDNKIGGFWITDFVSTENYNSPSYVNTNTFVEEDIVIGDEWKLPGTLSKPITEDVFPAVVLVHGSGPNDRDETIGPNKPFKDIAWGLASNNIIVLRYDKRTKTYSEDFSSLTNYTVEEEVIDDVIYAVDFLKNDINVDKKNIFIIGHSLGGMLAPRIALQDPGIKGIIILAGPARKLEDLINNQTKYISNIDGIIDENESLQIEYTQEIVTKIKDLNFSDNELIFGAYKSYWKDLNNYNQIETANSLIIDILILQGERDYQVTLTDYNMWFNSIGSKDNVKLNLYPNLNHLFMTGVGNSTPDEYQKEGHVEEIVIEDIIQWIYNSIQR